MTIRIIFLISICIGSIFLPLWFFALACFWYVIRYPGYELCIIALFIDGIYGRGDGITPYTYTLVAFVLTVCSILIKPHIKFYA